MDGIGQIIFKVVLVLLHVLVVMIIMTRVIMKTAFKIRSDGSPRLKYLQAHHFKNLKTKRIFFPSNKKQILYGNLYFYDETKQYKELVIFMHGIGAGHTAYTTEINTLAKAGFLVLAFDYTGASLSEGQSIRNLLQPLVDLKYSLKYINKVEELKDLDLYLVGHSWGAFTSLNALLFKNSKIKKVVSMSAFNNMSSVMSMNHPTLVVFRPFINLYNFFRYGKLAYTSSKKALKKTKAEVLVIHGDQDPVIKKKKSFDLFMKATQAKENIKYVIAENKKHNPYLTIKAEEYLYQVQVDKGLIGNNKQVNDDLVDYDLITKEDEKIMTIILSFLKG